ncbi:MAG: hypothetical protein KatS3mg110_2609 [Pirellulaceae bacterium]|nr:MAG: hypothetical protein KatS3mg110_2609 [Pirellulaceae bacterium]
MRSAIMLPFVSFVGLLGLALAGCHAPADATTASQAKDVNPSPTPAPEKSPAVPAAPTPSGQSQPAEKPAPASATQPAQIEPYEQTPLFARIDGYVGKTRTLAGENGQTRVLPLPDIGDRVEEGETLAELVVPELEQEVKKGLAAVAEAQAGVRQAEQARRVAVTAKLSAAARLAEAQAGLKRADGEYARWKAELDRVAQLAASGSLSEKLVDETRNQFVAAEAARHEAEARIESMQAELAVAEAKVAQAEADYAAAQARQQVAQAAFEHAQAMYSYRKIVAPFAGVVTQRNVDPGHLVRPPQGGGSRPLFVVARTDRVRVVADFPERDAVRIRPGSRAVVRIPALADREIPDAQVTRTAWLLDPVARTLRTEIHLENSDGTLRPGMYATVTVFLE